LLTFRRAAVTRRAVSPASFFRLPVSSFRLPAFSAPASASVADEQEAVPASPRRAEACAAADARRAAAFADAERVAVSPPDDSVRDGWPLDERSRDGYSAGPQVDGHSALLAQRGDSSEGGTAPNCLVEMDGYSAGPQAGGSSREAELDGSSRDDCSRDDYSAGATRGDSSASLADGSTLPTRQGADLEPADWAGGSLVGWRVG
jgi:hypothetical protein